MKAILGLAWALIIVIIVVIVVDVASPPQPSAIGCTLNRRIILPDICVGSCGSSTVTCLPATTRPYGFFFTQASTCPTILVCRP
jgi:hypothetical protein